MGDLLQETRQRWIDCQERLAAERECAALKAENERLNLMLKGFSVLFPNCIGQGTTIELTWINNQTLGELQARSVAYEEYRNRADAAEAERDSLKTEIERLKRSLLWIAAEKHSAQADAEREKNVADSLRSQLAAAETEATFQKHRADTLVPRIDELTDQLAAEKQAREEAERVVRMTDEVLRQLESAFGQSIWTTGAGWVLKPLREQIDAARSSAGSQNDKGRL